jgi:pimeloyl-ACP methyl ester carboxylesterase
MPRPAGRRYRAAVLAALAGCLGIGLSATLAVTAAAGGPVPGSSARRGPAGTAPATVAQGPAGDAFYTPPTPLPAGAPGDPVRYRRQPATLFTLTANATAYLVMYRSTNATGGAVAVTGTIFVPNRSAPAGRPVVALAPGTQGVGDPCAPSRRFLAGLEYDQLYVGELLKKNYAVAVTDYEGLGTPGDHTYIVGRSEGRAVLDSARAAARLPGTGVGPTGKVAVIGYSQGGGAAGWAAELQPSYAPELNLVGVAAGGVPADLTAVSSYLNGGVGMAFLLYSAIGLNAAYPELDLPAYLNDRGRQALRTDATSCVEGAPAVAFTRIGDYTTTDPLARPDWRARAAENSLSASTTRPSVPLFLYQGTIDEIIPYGQAAALRARYCAQGVPVRWNTYVGEHLTTFALGETDALSWLAARLAGASAPTNC